MRRAVVAMGMMVVLGGAGTAAAWDWYADDGAARVFTLDSPALTPADWDNIHVVVIADYRPGGSSGAYDTLQAAIAIRLDIFQDGFESGDTSAWSVTTD